MSTSPFTYAHTVEADVSAEAVWDLYDDVTTWPQWDAQAERFTNNAAASKLLGCEYRAPYKLPG